ncbi:YbaB/EbfC family nucleoid-associated protein [Stackebrandtia nassauensis]|uniref:YbaB/EbfC DNA-binding family protein n=1 Tax=Stackebrandtia nassauensis (strain DSM 44728 / CIP 108903 / NRRL B-16338 / NBRC 102104 / LLR-40K-21) TaxID=446470 RepID=D3PYU2_STANL|nr:YbaB/EbfC family nucleoid-associated protein [Stackebrandtia nassauensis]ADD43525.1 hypothetical protein Snas_3870 [Stackebrandtia nassauensis DSM 44728]
MTSAEEAVVAEIAENSRKIREFEEKLAAAEITVTSPGNHVRMTCDSVGNIHSIQFNRAVPHDVDHRQLSRELVQTLNSARNAGNVAREKFLNGLEMDGDKVGDRLRHSVTADEILRRVFGD